MIASPRFPAMVRSVLLAALLVLGWLTPAAAQSASPAGLKPMMVVELFTSQGCNSCPPADALLLDLMKLQDKENLIVLGYHVDYWDYLGWADTFAKPIATQRQKGYMRPLRMQSVFTPQIVVGGRMQAIGSDREAVDRAIMQARSALPGGGARVAFDFRDNGETFLKVEAPQEPVRFDGADVWLVLFASPMTVAITRGENAGQTIAYGNVVRNVIHLAKWDGLTTTFKLPSGNFAGDAAYCAAIVQMPNQGPILGAARIAMKNGGY